MGCNQARRNRGGRAPPEKNQGGPRGGPTFLEENKFVWRLKSRGRAPPEKKSGGAQHFWKKINSYGP